MCFGLVSKIHIMLQTYLKCLQFFWLRNQMSSLKIIKFSRCLQCTYIYQLFFYVSRLESHKDFLFMSSIYIRLTLTAIVLMSIFFYKGTVYTHIWPSMITNHCLITALHGMSTNGILTIYGRATL